MSAAVGVAALAGVPNAAAATSPSQQWMTSTTGTVTGVGGSIDAAFGSTGVTAQVTLTGKTGNPPMPRGAAIPVTSAAGTANSTTFIEPDPPTGSASILQGAAAGTSTTEVITFNKPVIAPMLHIVNIDGSSVTVAGSTTTGAPISVSTVVKNNALSVVGNQINTSRHASNAGCQADNGSNANGGCGSFTLGGSSVLVQSLTLTNTGAFGDGWAWTLSFPTAQLTKAFSPAAIRPGGTSQLSFTVTNPGDPAQPTLVPLDFTDDLPSGLTLAGSGVTNNGNCGTPLVSGSGGAPLAAGGTVVAASGISVAAGSTCVITVTVTAAAAGSYTNDNSNLSTSVANLVLDSDATLTAQVPPQATVTLTKHVNARITPADQFAVGLQDSSGTALTTVTTTGDQTSAVTAAATVEVGSTYTVTDTMAAGSISRFSSYTATLSCTDTATGQPLTTGGSPGAWTITPTGAGDYACSITNGPAPGAVRVTKSVSPGGPVRPGSIVTYTVIVENRSSQPATGVEVSDDLADATDDATYNNDATSGATLTGTDTLRWVGSLAAAGSPGDTATITYSVTVKSPDTGDGMLHNLVAGGANCYPDSTDPTCSTDTEVLAVVASPTPTSTASGTSSSASSGASGSGGLAATGSDVELGVLAGTATLIVGAALVIVATARRRP